MIRVDASQPTVIEEIVRGAANLIIPHRQQRGPIINKKDVKKYQNVPNASPDHKTAMYLRIPPPTDKSLAADTFYKTNPLTKRRVIGNRSLKLDCKTDDSENADVTSEDESS